MFNTESVRSRIESVAISEAKLSPAIARDVAFHLTDWLGDLAKYVRLCEDPASHTDEQANAILLALLLHAPNHLAAAAKLYADFPVTDLFGVGAIEVRED
jgi:hypothetical protein